jgi:hypothetical protein
MARVAIPAERLLLLYAGTDPEAAAYTRDELDPAALPHDDWRRLYALVVACGGDPDRVRAALDGWPWGYHQWWAAAEIPWRVIVRHTADEMVGRLNWKAARGGRRARAA